MNIAVDARPLSVKELTGVGVYTFNLLKELLKADTSNRYFLFVSGRKIHTEYLDQLCLFPQIRLIHWKISNKLLNCLLFLFRRPRLDLFIKKQTGEKIDTFFFPNLNFFAVRCPYAITAHDLGFLFFPEFLSWKRRLWHLAARPRRAYARAEKIIAVSANTRRDLLMRFGVAPEKIVVIYSGIDYQRPNEQALAALRQTFNLPEKFILFVGTLEPRKNLALLLESFKKFGKDKPAWHLLIAGSRGWRSRSLLKQISATPRARYWEYISEKQKNGLYSMASMFVFPSIYEGFGFPPLEALAAGCPVITSPNSSLCEILENAALYANAFDSNDWARAMEEMLTAPLAQEFQRRGLVQAAKYHWRQTAAHYLKMINLLK